MIHLVNYLVVEKEQKSSTFYSHIHSMFEASAAFAFHNSPIHRSCHSSHVYLRRSKCSRRPVRITCLADSFEEAVTKGYVHDFGRVIPLDKTQLTTSNDLQISPQHRDVFQDILSLILQQARRHHVRAVFLRGSIVTGQFFDDGRSDVDLIIITQTALPDVTKTRLRRAVHEILSKSIHVCATDITFKHTRHGALSIDEFNIDAGLMMILHHHAVALYGSINDLNIKVVNSKYDATLAMNIRADERRFERGFSQASQQHDFKMQQTVLQWLCKRCLRAVGELCSHDTHLHSRDLVPCFRMGANSFPQFSENLLSTLQIACASPDRNFAGLSLTGFLDEGCVTAHHAVEIVEDLFLQRFFHSVGGFVEEASNAAAFVTDGQESFVKSFQGAVDQKIASIRWSVSSFARKYEFNMPFLRRELVKLAVRPVQNVKERKVDDLRKGYENCESLTPLLTPVAEPVAFRDAGLGFGIERLDSFAILEDLMRSHITVDCRVSASNVVTFCRSQHAWIADGLFSPPSVLKRLDVYEAIERLYDDDDRRIENSALAKGRKDNREYVYIQTKVRRNERVFKNVENNVDIAQSERIWISTHGMISSLHYDASFSALFQRTGRKRMVFFPKEALRDIGIYPFGHPLHRRGRVNICRRDSPVFHRFWTLWGHRAVETIVNAGDLLLFPPGWAHYTESLTAHETELCVSHTFRYW